MEYPDFKKTVMRGIRNTPKVVETFKLDEPPKEVNVPKTHEFCKVAKSYVLVKISQGPGAGL